MRYLTLAETLTIAEEVTGLDRVTPAKASRLELLDSALHAPQAGFGEEEFYPDVEQKAAVLAVRIARNLGRSPGLGIRLSFGCRICPNAEHDMEIEVGTFPCPEQGQVGPHETKGSDS